MKFVTFQKKCGEIRAGWIAENKVIDMHERSKGKLPTNMKEFLESQEEFLPLLEVMQEDNSGTYSIDEVVLLAPLPNPTSFRDFISFETHIKNVSEKMGIIVAKEWYEIPVFYFSNHNNIKGPNDKIKRPTNCRQLDFELEIGCIIGRQGKNIKVSEAEKYIFGYTILNDWTARDLQFKEMKVNLGPAKGKDFATSIGPYIVTKDELNECRVENKYDLKMTAKIKGKQITEGNFKSIHYSFAEMIERASKDVMLYPGDLIGSGTVGNGCILEHDSKVHPWLEPGDEVTLEITNLGKLTNKIV